MTKIQSDWEKVAERRLKSQLDTHRPSPPILLTNYPFASMTFLFTPSRHPRILIFFEVTSDILQIIVSCIQGGSSTKVVDMFIWSSVDCSVSWY